MKAAILTSPQDVSKHPLRIGQVPQPEPKPGQVLLRVRACGVCRTDLHIVEGELPVRREGVIPGHQIVGEIVDRATAEFPMSMRVGVSWIGGTDEKCWYCQRGLENLCDSPTFTGYTVDGGYAEYALARSDFVFPLPDALDDLHAAPLLCAGIIGFRSLRVAGVEPGDRVGLFGFGASAHLAIAVLRRGTATCTCPREVRRIALWRNPSARFGWAKRRRNRQSRWTAPSRSRRLATL